MYIFVSFKGFLFFCLLFLSYFNSAVKDNLVIQEHLAEFDLSISALLLPFQKGLVGGE